MLLKIHNKHVSIRRMNPLENFNTLKSRNDVYENDEKINDNKVEKSLPEIHLF